MKTANVYRGGQRRKCIGSIKRVAVLAAVVLVALIVDTVSGRDGIQAKAATIASGEQGDTTWVADIEKGTLTITPKPGTDGDLKLEVHKPGTGYTIPRWHPDYLKDKFNNNNAGDLITTINVTGKIHSPQMYYLFADFKKVTAINGLENFDTSDTTDMAFMFDGCSSLKQLDLSNFKTSKVIDMSGMFCLCCKITTLDLSHFDTSSVQNMWSMFEECTSLKTLNINFNTMNVKDMHRMFRDCRLLNSVSTSNFDTSNVTDMSEMFHFCESMASLDLSNFNTSKVTSMYQMLAMSNDYITNLDVSNFDTSKVTTMHGMFSGLDKVSVLDVSNFDTSNVVDMANMFWKCESVTGLDVSNFDTSNVTNMGGMFQYCYSITSLDLTHFNTSKVDNMSEMFSYTESLKHLDINNFNTSNVTGMHQMFNATGLNELDLHNFNVSKVTDMDRMFSTCNNLANLDISNFNTINVKNMHEMFYECSSLRNLDLSSFNFRNVTNMESMFDMGTKYSKNILENIDFGKTSTPSLTTIKNMFRNCSSLVNLDLSNFDTSHVTNMASAFCNCDFLKNLKIDNFDTSNVIDMYGMFSDCSSLTSLDVSHFNTSNVTNMMFMFKGCSSLTSLDVSRFDTSNVTSMSNMFSDCSSLTSLDVSHFNTSNVTSIMAMFRSCSSLTLLDVSHFDTQKVKGSDMADVFDGCSALTSLDVSHFDTSNVTNMERMFKNCSSLTELDLSNFNTSKVTNMDWMFKGCSSLQKLDVSSFDTTAVVAEDLKTAQRHSYRVTQFNNMFDLTSRQNNKFTIVLGPKCYTCVFSHKTYDNRDVIYKSGIQYSLPFVSSASKQKYIIKQKEGKFNSYNYYYSHDNNKIYCGQSEIDGKCYDNPFADAWVPEMAGTWTIMPVETESTQYTITFKDGLTSATISASSVEKGDSVSAPAAPSHDGYKFVEWDNKDKLTNIQSDVIVTAIYKKIEKPITKYMVMFKDGLTNSIISSSAVEAGASVSVPVAPSHDGYKFVRWDNKDKLLNIQSDVTVIAQYEKIDIPKKQYTIAFKDSVTGKIISSIRAEEGTSVIVPVAPKHDGYEFISWDNKDKLTNIQSDVIVTSIYKKIEKPVTKYTITFKDGLVNTVISSSVVEEGTNVSVPTAPEHDGYEFVSWDNEDKLTNIQSDVTIIATYKKIEKPDNQPKQTVLPVKSDDNNQTISNQPNELEQTGIDLPSFLVPLSAILFVFLIVYYRRRSK